MKATAPEDRIGEHNQASTGTPSKATDCPPGVQGYRAQGSRRLSPRSKLHFLQCSAKFSIASRLNLRTPTRIRCAISLSVCSHFPPMEGSKFARPVIFPPGRARFETMPIPSGSEIPTKTTRRDRTRRLPHGIEDRRSTGNDDIRCQGHKFVDDRAHSGRICPSTDEMWILRPPPNQPRCNQTSNASMPSRVTPLSLVEADPTTPIVDTVLSAVHALQAAMLRRLQSATMEMAPPHRPTGNVSSAIPGS